MGSLPNPRIRRSKWSYFRSFSEGHPGGNLWDIWGKLVNDWASAKKKPAFIKVCKMLSFWKNIHNCSSQLVVVEMCINFRKPPSGWLAQEQCGEDF